ncbi:hypothetical protein [Chloroflexus sp. MS-G]|uniref:hypothetical protein n=1 Tax=Chloroflexus sp. MS-G TaxID=1521187 RepID=UPI0004DEF651|nr:hypothetical protein [Chloroflexus sp. MS-G]
MRRSLLLCLLSMAIVLSVSSVVHAQPLPGTGWYSTATIQNVGSATANVNLAVYPQQSTSSASTASFTLDVGASKVFVAGGNNASGTVDVSPPLASGSGSAVISSDQPVVAIGSIQNNQLSAFPGLGVSGGNAAEFFRGASQAGTSLFYPVVKNNFFNRTTVFSIQAAGSDAKITATIRANNGSIHTKTLTIQANRSVFLVPNDFTPPMASGSCGSNANTSPCFGSLSITSSSGSIVGAYIEFQTAQPPAQLVLAASMFANTEADNKIYCPVIKNEFVGRTTGMTIANTSNVTVTVNVTYTVYQVMPGVNVNVGSTYTESGVTIPANGSVVFSRFNSNIGGMPPGTLAAAVVEGSTNSLVGVVNESNFSGTPVRATAYTCFGEDSATNRLAAPLFKRNVAGVTSALVVQNVGANNVTMTATFKCGTSSPVTVTTGSIAPGSSFNFSGFRGAPLMDDVPFNQNCAVTVTVPSGGKIVGIAQETAQFGTVQPNLNTKNYEAFNLPNT